MRLTDVVPMMVVLTGNRLAAGGTRDDCAAALRVFGVSLFGGDASSPVVRFDGEGGPREFPAWFESLRPRGLASLRLAGLRLRPPGGDPLPERVAHGFGGAERHGVVPLLAGGEEGWLPTIRRPPAHTLRLEDLVAFLDEAPRREEMIESMRWENAMNLRIAPAEATWEETLAAAGPGDVAELVDAFHRVMDNVKFERESDGWSAYVRRFENPDRRPRVTFREVGPPDPKPAPSVAGETERMRAALRVVSEVSAAEGWDGWQRFFDETAETIDVVEDGARPIADALEPLLSPPALRLLLVSFRADAFGGMGSFNDVMPDDREAYEAACETLLGSIRTALRAAVAPEA